MVVVVLLMVAAPLPEALAFASKVRSSVRSGKESGEVIHPSASR